MKKSILGIAALLFIGTSMVSCKKDYRCQCTKTYTSGTGSSSSNYSVYTYDDTRRRAEERCNDNTSTGSDLGGNYSVNCAIE
ncbi:MAG: hypothetical protein H0X46_06750 [Bacteroidetes bacterium]|nr:hypothetical protein [Bacteroidota bacterium]